MRIIKQGRLPGDRIWHGTCHNCKTEAEAEERELQITHDQRDGPFGECKCPLCGARMIFYPKER